MNNNNVAKLKDKRRKNWFWDSNFVFGSNLSAHAKLIRLYLAKCSNDARQAWPSYNKIAKDCIRAGGKGLGREENPGERERGV